MQGEIQVILDREGRKENRRHRQCLKEVLPWSYPEILNG